MRHDFSVRWPQLSAIASIKYPRICETVLATGCPAIVEIHGRLFKINQPKEYSCTCKGLGPVACAGCRKFLTQPPQPREVEVYGPSAIPRIEARNTINDN